MSAPKGVRQSPETEFGAGKSASEGGKAGSAARWAEREVLHDSDILDLIARSVKHLRGVMGRKSVNDPAKDEDLGGVGKEKLRRKDALQARRDKIALEVVKNYIGPNVVTRLTDNARARGGKGVESKTKGLGASVADAAAVDAPEGNA